MTRKTTNKNAEHRRYAASPRLLGSGTTAMPCGILVNPETSAALTVAPVEASYSPIVPPIPLATNRFPPDTAIPFGSPRPVTNCLLIAAPVVASNSPTDPPFDSSVANRFPPDTAMPHGPPINPVTSEALTVAPAVVYSLILPKP